MEQIGDMKFVDFEEILERDLGKIGTPKRDEFERKVDETVKKELSIAELFAEREGFEPPVPLSTVVFKTTVIDHSTISPVL